MFEGTSALAAAPEVINDPAVLPAPGVHIEEWEESVRRVHADRIHVGALLQHGRPVDYRHEVLTIAVPDDFHRRMLGSEDAYLAVQLHEGLSVPIQRIRLVVQEDLQKNVSSETASQMDPLEYFNRKRQENPVVRAIFEQFGGEIVW